MTPCIVRQKSFSSSCVYRVIVTHQLVRPLRQKGAQGEREDGRRTLYMVRTMNSSVRLGVSYRIWRRAYFSSRKSSGCGRSDMRASASGSSVAEGASGTLPNGRRGGRSDAHRRLRPCSACG